MKPQAREWTRKADEDWAAANRLSRGKKPIYNLVCFHAQQCLEKYLKAVLEQKAVPVPRTHDLAVLVELAQPELNALLLQKPELEILSGYAVASRYPGDNATKAQAHQSLRIASSIRKSVRQLLGLRNQP